MLKINGPANSRRRSDVKYCPQLHECRLKSNCERLTHNVVSYLQMMKLCKDFSAWRANAAATQHAPTSLIVHHSTLLCLCDMT